MMILKCFFYKKVIYRRYIITRKNVTNENIDRIVPCLKQLAILMRPFAISSGESWYKLLVPHNITTFLKDEKRHKSYPRHSTCSTLSPLIPQLKSLNGLENLFQTLL